ncbi:MAG TPA: TonB-dependent receptor [Sandaracinaceae bacterium LLY-WYZ-13_1]|nr:TonB-dependent receptor [Sandaracinaceae bacterium LLY-WYZ-13_1]
MSERVVRAGGVRLVLLVLLASLGITAAARAQEASEPQLTPPELEDFVEAEVAPEALPPPGETAEVVLTLLIAPDGTVREAEVFRSAGEPFDAAAVAAARQLTFRPASRDGEAIPARIRFRYAFDGPEPVREEPEAPEEPSEEAATTPARPGALGGRALAPEGEPIAGAQVFADATDGSVSRQGETDADGAFTFEDLPPGDYLLSVVADGFEALDATETVAPGEALELTYRLVAAEDEDDDEAPHAELGVTARVERPRREATRRTLQRDVLTRIPGTRGDALRVVELLPGVARPAFGTGALIIRGAAPGDSEVFVNGVSVPLLYHFGGLTSFYNSRLLERIDFYPGNFSVRYGRRIGGILEVEPREPATDRDFGGILDINLLDSSLLIETPLWENASLALAARRSYVDFFFSEVVPPDLFDVIAAPVYYDYQLIFNWRPGNQDRLRLFVYGSSDEFRTIFNGDEFARPFGLELSTQFHRAQAEWRHVYDDTFQQDVTFAGGWTGLVIQAGEAFGFDAEFVPLTFRSEWKLELAEEVQMRWGIDWTYTPTILSFRGPAPTQTEGQPAQTDPDAPEAAAAFDGDAYRPGIYVESTLTPFDPLTVVLGLRLDYYRDISDWSFDPRMTFRLRVAPEWTVKGGVGVFSQPPEFQQTAPGLGNPDLDPITSLHTSAGVEWEPDRVWQLEVEGYYKHIFDRVVGTPGGLPPFFTNEGIGRIYGAEVSIRANRTPDFPIYGFLSYTLSRSERLDNDGEWRLFDFDQTHILSLAVVWRIGDGWEAGGTFRLVSGNPYTPVTGSLYDVAADTYRPIYGPVNSERNPFFHRLDLRVEKIFEIDTVRLAIYLDVQNVYNAMNREATAYSFDYRERADVPGLPILPSLGIRGEL